jgi:hypothetical protein
MHISRNETLTILHVELRASIRVETRLRAERPENRSSIPDGADVYSIQSRQSGTGVQPVCYPRDNGSSLYKVWKEVKNLENFLAAAWEGRDRERGR